MFFLIVLNVLNCKFLVDIPELNTSFPNASKLLYIIFFDAWLVDIKSPKILNTKKLISSLSVE